MFFVRNVGKKRQREVKFHFIWMMKQVVKNAKMMTVVYDLLVNNIQPVVMGRLRLMFCLNVRCGRFRI